MSVPKLQLRSRLANAEELLRGKMLTEDDVALLLRDDADVYKPDGEPLLMLRKGGIGKELGELAYPALHELRKQKTSNRGNYSGARRVYGVNADGTRNDNSYTRDAEGKRFMVASAIVGYFDKQGGRFPFCRETAFTGKEPEAWATILPMIQAGARLFKDVAPTRYGKQMAACAKCPPEFVIGHTPFTTLTVNNNVAPSATHKDAGDYKDGLGLISVVRRGDYSGAWLVFPEYRVAVDLADGDALFFNSHEWHGVTPMVKLSEDAERISIVYYMREKMRQCLPAAQQLEALRAGQLVETAEEPL